MRNRRKKRRVDGGSSKLFFSIFEIEIPAASNPRRTPVIKRNLQRVAGDSYRITVLAIYG